MQLTFPPSETSSGYPFPLLDSHTMKSLLIASLLVLLPLSVEAAPEGPTRRGAEKDDTGHTRIPIQVTRDIHVVYQVSDDKLINKISRALFYADKLLDSYNENGIADSEIDLHLVFHGDSTNALVDTPTRKRLDAEGGETNPNRDILARLIARGVSVELCESSMAQREVETDDLLEGVATVRGAYPRLISLQHLGYAYIKFE